MRQFKIYGISSTLMVTVLAVGFIIYIVFNDILAFLVWLLVVFFVVILAYTLSPKIFRKMSDTVELRDTAISSRKTEIAGLICHECKTAKSLIEKVSAEIDTASAKGELDRLGQELASMKCCSSSFEVMPDELANVDMTFLTTRSAEVRDRLGAMKRALADKYKTVSDKRVAEYEVAMKSLREAGYGMGGLYAKFEAELSRSASTLDEMAEKEGELSDLLKDALTDCLEEAKRIASEESGRKGASEVSYALGKLTISDGELIEAASELAAMRKKLQSIMGGDFFAAKESIIDSMDAVLLAANGPGFSDLREKLAKLRDSVNQLKDPGKLGRLKETEKEYRELAKTSIEELSAKALAMKDELDSYKPPREMQAKLPQKIVAPGGGTSEFTKKISSMLKELSPEIEELIRNVKIMRSYQKAERLIDARLAENKKVQARDLDIKYPEVFFMLYKKKHPKVKLVEGPEPKLFEE